MVDSHNKLTTQEIINDMISKDSHRIWKSSCEIVALGQDKSAILQLIPYIEQFESETKGVKLGGAFASNQRFLDAAIKTLKFHRDSTDCPCQLLGIHDCMDPKRQVDIGYLKISNIERIENKWVDFYEARCTRCNQKFKIIERVGHYMWWSWEKVN